MFSLSDVNLVINQLLPEPHAGLLSGILFGTKASLDPELKEALIRSGTLHITALSGMNITILSSLIATTLLRVFSRRITSLLTIGIVIGFVLFVGLSPSVIRAAIMGCLALFSVVFGRQKSALLFLFLAGGIMLIISPSYIADIAFQLSFLATLGLILFAKKSDHHYLFQSTDLKPYQIWFGKFSSFIKDDLRTTMAAQVFTIPIFFFEFHRLSLISPVSNLLIGWLIAPLTTIGLLLCVVGLVWLPLAAPLSWITWVCLQYMLAVILFVSKIPFASFEW